ncbi:MAG: cation transporter [Oscillospiraceae bacterium]|nr:cation transporter [Oscillospiraceae bacterium]
MNLLYKLLRQNPASREGVVVTTSALGLLVNLPVAVVKIVIGLLSSSLAILSEGAHNAADAATSLLTIVGTKLANRRPSKKYPFGFGRIEYLTGLVIAGLILVTGVEFLLSAVEQIRHPVTTSIAPASLWIIAGSAVIKLALGLYTIRTGKRVGSAALEAVGVESRNDSLISTVTILSALVYIIFGVSVDAWAGLFTAALILKAGLELLLETLDDLLGTTPDKELADKLYKEIRACPLVINAADLCLHNYGPDSYRGSANLELAYDKSVEEVYATIHELQLRIMHELGVTMVFGIYAVDNTSPDSRALRACVAQFVRQAEHVESYHALFRSEKEKRIYCDFIVDYELRDWEKLERDFAAYMAEQYPGYSIELTVETAYI